MQVAEEEEKEEEEEEEEDERLTSSHSHDAGRGGPAAEVGGLGVFHSPDGTQIWIQEEEEV
jgi:hypothetical protein